MSTAVVTGASAGLGMSFARQLRDYFPGVDRLWLIARRRDRLEKLAGELEGLETEILSLDLCDKEDLKKLGEKLAAERPEVSLLINNAGCGYLGNLGDGDVERQVRMTDLNVTALTAVTHMVLPHMPNGGRIINVSSIASFCPNPRMTVYSSTKAYVSSFTRGLSVELRGRGIAVTAVCPGPMATEFLKIGRIQGNSRNTRSSVDAALLRPGQGRGRDPGGVPGGEGCIHAKGLLQVLPGAGETAAPRP